LVAQPIVRSLYRLSYPNSESRDSFLLEPHVQPRLHDPPLAPILSRFDSLHTFTSYL